jgi:hypothetical protein
MHRWDYLTELFFGERLLTQFSMVTSLSKTIDTRLVNPLKEEDLHFFSGKRILLFHAAML